MNRVTLCKVSEFNKTDHIDCRNPATVRELDVGLFTDFSTAKYHWGKVFEKNEWRGEWYKEFGGTHWTVFSFQDVRVRIVLKNEPVIHMEYE